VKLKILQISPQVPVPPVDGGKISIFGLLKALAERGHSIDFFCYRKHSDYNYSYNELSKFCNPRIIDVQTDNNVFKAFVNLFKKLPYNVSKFIRPEMWYAIKEYLKDNNPDIVHIDHIHMSWLIDHLRNVIDKPIVLREHNFESDIIYRYYLNQRNPISRMYFLKQYQRLLKFETTYAEKFDRVVMISDVDELKILKFNNNIKTTIIPAGVDNNLFQIKAYNHNKIPFSLFHIGDLEWKPNLDGLQWFVDEILPLIVKNFPKTQLFVYGKNTEKLIIPSELKKNVVKSGFVLNLWNELLDKQIGIVPLRIGSGIRIKVLELLAQGHLVVSTEIGKEGIPIVDRKHYLNANKPETFVEKISNVFKDFNDYKTICFNAQEFIKQNYAWSNVAEKFESLYVKLINNK
jgi:glycosyltransferase involved in cell wall biosynthesis